MPLIYGEGRKKALIWLWKEIKESLKDEFEDLPLSPSSNIPFLRDPDYID